MKKIFTLFTLGAAMLTASAQQPVQSHKFFDNWSIGVYGGAVTPTTRSLFSHTRGVAGLELTKQITPVFGLGVQSTMGFNTTGSYTAVDNVNSLLLGKVNFTNWFCGYKGEPRLFEVEGVGGIGFNRYFGATDEYAVANGTTFSSKLGLNLNFNLGDDKAWTVSLRPAIAYDMEGGRGLTQAQLNVNNSVLELTAGVVYHFKTSNGKHHFVNVKAYDQAEVDGLNAQINALRSDLSNKDGQLKAANARVRDLQAQLNDCRNRQPVVETVTDNRQSLESIVTFRQGKSVIDASQLPNVERIATYLKNHKEAKVVIKGYASPEGSAEINARLASERADAVKNMLINKYKIAASRIVSEGQGIGDMFSEPDWNRVSIATIDEAR